MKYILVIAAVLAFVPASAQAADYKPGSVGYLYEHCRKALQDSESLSELYETYCGAFIDGYVAAYIASSGQSFGTQKDDPCAADKEKLYERINNRFCPALPFYDRKKIAAGPALQETADIVARWVAYLKEKTAARDPLKAQAARALGTLLQPGVFCERLKRRGEGAASFFETNPALHRIDWRDSWQLKDAMSLSQKYKQCARDLMQSAGDPQRFRATRCGAEIEGYIAGLQPASALPAGAAPAPGCKKEVRRLARYLDAGQSMCVGPETDPVRVARIFLEQVERKTVSERRTLPASVGHESIYKGFLCVEKHADLRR